MSTRFQTWSAPETIDEYNIVKPLARGRSGLVYVAIDTVLERHVAIKFIPAPDESVLARFLVEARAAARIQHPNVATLYRVGEAEGHAYLVWELVRGRGLDELPRPVPPEQVLRIALDCARGLAAAHRRGVLHRDIKPANIMLADSGEAKLVDFGLATLMDADAQRARQNLPERVHGTPYFMPPEAWRGDVLDARSDLYSLGLVLYELVAGEGPFRTFTIKELPDAIQTTSPRPLQSVVPVVSMGFAHVVDRCLRREPAERFASADDLLAALDLLAPARAESRVPEGNPYRGLRTYDAEHRALFFGRSRPLQQALERLRAEAMVVVIGDSGVGKSSLCAAGIVPAVSEGSLQDGRRWLVARVIPGRHPLRAICATLGELVGIPAEALVASCSTDPSSLARTIRAALRDEDGLLLYVDQMEELVTLGASDAPLAAEIIASLAGGIPGIRVLATARSDFLSRLAGLPGLNQTLPPSLLLLGPMSSDEIREAIVGPATLKGGRFETGALVDSLVETTTSAQGSLPLLQFTLSELWEHRERETNTITAAALDSLGGVAGALARHADAVLISLPPERRTIARALLLRLVTIDDTRARRTEQELRAVSQDAVPVLEVLVRGRLLVVSETEDGASYEIAHEALVHGWTTLSSWLAEENELRAARHRLETAAAEWHRAGRKRDGLWSARQLSELDPRALEGTSEREQLFVEASRRGAAHARWVRRGALGAAVLAAAGAWLGAELKQRADTRDAIDRDLARADVSWFRSRVSAGARATAREAALAAWDGKKAEVAEPTWKQMTHHTDALGAALAETAGHLERALLRDPSRDDVRARYADLLLERVLFAIEDRRELERRELEARLSLYDVDGTRRAQLARPGSVVLHTTPPGANVTFSRYDGSESLRTIGAASVALAPGAWIATVEAPGHAVTRLPLYLDRGERVERELRLPAVGEVPEGFVFMPPGEGLFGSAEAEAVRTWFNAVPLHLVSTAGYLIARHETTFAEWIEYLRDLPPADQERRRPRVAGTGFRGMLELAPAPGGRWTITLQPTEHRMQAAEGEPVHYAARDRRARQDWLRMPVTGVSYEDAVDYVTWLRRTARLRTARLCTEWEWERAARGTDNRPFPHGNVLRPDDANIDETYGKQPGGFGPDEVGSHPAGASPFGVLDLAGNAWEWVRSSVAADQVVARGGSYYFSGNTARVANRELPEPTYRDLTVGFRICADWPMTARNLLDRGHP